MSSSPHPLPQVNLSALYELPWVGPAQAAALATAFPTLGELVRFCVDPSRCDLLSMQASTHWLATI